MTEQNSSQYFIKINVPGFKCDFRFESIIEGWKPLGNKIVCRSGKKKSDFSWVIPVPRARIRGYFIHENTTYKLTGAIGYHDHNYIKVDRTDPLYLDEMVSRWYWGKCYAGDYTFIFMDTHLRKGRTLSLMVADKDTIIHSSNNLIDCFISLSAYDNILKVEYPKSLSIRSLNDLFSFKAEFVSDRILDRKDLLEGLNPPLKFIIKQLVAKPAYHGILARVKLEMKNLNLVGTGNFESMVFRRNKISLQTF